MATVLERAPKKRSGHEKPHHAGCARVCACRVQRSINELASAVCGFPILTEFPGKQKVLAFPNGRLIILFPAYKQTWVNQNTGRTVTKSLTGSFHINPLPNGNTEIVFTGNNAILGVFDDPADNFFVFLSGRFTNIVGPDGTLVQDLGGNGRRIDVCPLLA
jgi:hypothetical protein